MEEDKKTDGVAEPTASLSKNALKRLLKKQKHEETKEEWRRKIREKRKLARKRRIEVCKEQGLPIPKKFKPSENATKTGTIIFDLDYSGLMKDNVLIISFPIGPFIFLCKQEINSLCSQISRCYASNRRSSKPFNLKMTAFIGEIADKFKTSFKDYEKWDIEAEEGGLGDCINLDKVIYLSGDAKDTLETLEDDYIYVIGGIVDRNRHKGASLARAIKHKVKSAKLPILENATLSSCKILTVYHVFEILSKYREIGSWKEAICHSIPERKVAQKNLAEDIDA